MATKLTTYDIVGSKEDVSDIISRITPTETPFTSGIASEKIHNTVHSFQEMVLRPVDLNNAGVQGAVFNDQELSVGDVRQTNTQIMRKVINVAATTDAVAKYGRDKETVLQLEMRGAEIKIDKEAIYLGGQAASLGNSTTGAKTPSFQSQVAASLRIATGSATTTPTATLVKDTLQALKIGGSKANTIMVPFADSNVPGTWAQATSINNVRQVPNSGAAASGVYDYVDYFVTPTGRLDVVLNLYSLDTDYFIYNPKDHKDCVLRPWTRETLAKVQDGTRMAIVGEYAYKNVNSKSSAVIRKVTGTNGKF